MNSNDISDLREVAEAVAREAGQLVKDFRERGVEVANRKSTDTDVVTAADMAAEELIRTRLRVLRPQDGILGEEAGEQRGTSGLTWVVDPIDGTVNYLHGLPEYSVSVAVVTGEPTPERWQVEAGCVYRPDDGLTYGAGRGQGAWKNSSPLQVSAPVELSRALVATGFAYDANTRRRQAEILTTVLPQIADIRRGGSAALDLAATAAGQFAAFYETGLSPWDMAAGELIITEAGGVVQGLNGAKASESITVAGEESIVRKLSVLLESLDADQILSPER